MDDKRYIKLFNYGYFLFKKEPNVLKNLLSATKGFSSVQEPIKLGKSEFVKEQLREKLNSLDNYSSETLDIGLEPEK